MILPENPLPAPNSDPIEDLLDRFGLTDDQKAAARERRRDVAVTAGAGSGKTRTLVARYLPLLAELRSPRRIVAITFTEKAAREMRNRIRDEVRKIVLSAQDDLARQEWIDLEAQLDAARISTIHSLCQEILRAHPVEAGLDTQFEVIDEGQAAVLLSQAAHSALVAVIEQAEFQPLFSVWRTGTLESLLQTLMRRRLDLDEHLGTGFTPQQGVRRALANWLASSEVQAALVDLHTMKANGSLAAAADSGDKLAPLAIALLANLEQAAAGIQSGDTTGAALALFTARQEHLSGRVGKNGQLKELVKSLREDYDRRLGWLSGAKAGDPAPDPQLEEQMSAASTLLIILYRQARDRYLAELRRRSAIDFDDLESTALQLLRLPEIASRWQSEISAVLVDEFQDTNPRQREIVRALCGLLPGKLFVVGDARQSIYRFRGADVTVFRSLQDEIRAQGGLSIDLGLTFRAHTGLLTVLGDLLAPIMGRETRVDQPYHVPYSDLTAHRKIARAGSLAPHAAFLLGAGADSESGRTAAAHVLCDHLLGLKQAGQIRSWDEVALLFRASTGFPAYEDALEAQGIPYVTVAGGGFYDRPEIRDLLNLLQSLADPWDDLALTGLLCSPAFGVSPSGLVRLRWQGNLTEPAVTPQIGGRKTPLYQALQGDLSGLAEADRKAAEFARAFITELSPLVDRIPVAELLERMVSFTDYRAILAGDASRLWRNLDKLLADAQASGIVQVQAFLEYLGQLRDVGAREGEASLEAEGAVRLMTIHKSKGLEFEFVVLADAARQGLNRAERFYLLAESGLAFKAEFGEGDPLAYRFARAVDKSQSEAETCRLLYVALTRANEKVLISGHLTDKDGKLETRGWMKDLLAAAGVDLSTLNAAEKTDRVVPLKSGQGIGLRYDPADAIPLANETARQEQHASAQMDSRRPIFAPWVSKGVDPLLEEEESGEIDWRVSGQAESLLGKAVGLIVHGCIQRWRFPGSADFEPYLGALAREQGLYHENQLAMARNEAEKMLRRFQAHSLWQVMDLVALRRHEVPYSLLRQDGSVEGGYLDVLYRRSIDSAGWEIVDFKTDTIQSEGELNMLVDRYSRQLRRYSRVVERLLGPVDGARFCFLDDRGKITLKEV